MSDPNPDQRGNSDTGSAADRKPTTKNVTAYGAALSLTIGTADWLVQCSAGGWHWVAPSQTWIEMAAPIILLPVGLWFTQVFSLVGDIIISKLRKDDRS